MIERKIDLGVYNVLEDINYDIDLAVIDVKGVYYSVGYFTDPNSGEALTGLWSRGQSDDWVRVELEKGAQALTMAISFLALAMLYF